MQDHCSPPPLPGSSSWGGAGGSQSVRQEDVRALLQDELHHLILEHHGHGHAGFLRFRAAAAWARRLWPRSALTCGSVLRARSPCSGVGRLESMPRAGGRGVPGPLSPFPRYSLKTLTGTGAGRAPAACRGIRTGSERTRSRTQRKRCSGSCSSEQGRVRGRRGETDGADFGIWRRPGSPQERA